MKGKKVLLLVFLAILIFAGWEIQALQSEEPQDLANAAWLGDQIRVMTRNIYVGGNVDRVIEAEPEELLAALTETLDELLYTNFPNRAEALAMEIKRWKPHLVGLQEVSYIDIHLPDMGLVFTLDYETIFMETLKAFGCEYNVAGKVENTDATVYLGPSYPNHYVRLVDYDMTIARKDVKISKIKTGNYQARFTVPSIGVDVIRGWVAVNANVNGRKCRFVNTHLEPFVPEVKMGQAQELLTILETINLPIICVGDFNTLVPDDPVYELLVASGLVDT